MTSEPIVRFAAVGDIMLGDSSHFIGRGVGSAIEAQGPDHAFAGVRDLLGAADILLGNLESPLTAAPGSGSWEKVYRGRAQAAEILNLAERTIVTLANNHILEHGRGVYEETRRILDRAGVRNLGFPFPEHGDPVLRWETGGQVFSLVCDSLIGDATGRTVDPDAVAARLLDHLAGDTGDVKIVSLHWGDEYVTVPSPRQRDLGHRLIDAGATVVLGHHPHVLQPVEEYDRGLIAYSLGNFLFDQDWTFETRTGGILNIEFGSGRIASWNFVPTATGRGGSVGPADGDAADRAREILAADPEVGEGEYRKRRAAGSRRHRVAMKTELLRNLFRVTPDTVHFLVTKRFRSRRQPRTS